MGNESKQEGKTEEPKRKNEKKVPPRSKEKDMCKSASQQRTDNRCPGVQNTLVSMKTQGMKNGLVFSYGRG